MDKEVIVWILGHRDAVQRKNIIDTYQQLFKESILHLLKSKLSGALRVLFSSLHNSNFMEDL